MRWIVPILILIVLQWYSFQAVKTLTSQKWIWVCYFAAVVLIIGNLVVHTLVLERSVVMEPRLMYAIGFFISLFVFQMIITLILLSEDVFRIPQTIYAYFSKFPGQTEFAPARRAFVSKLAIGIASIPLVSLLYGMYHGKYNYKVLKYTLTFDDLPEAFDGFTLTQISDLHSGSFDNVEKVNYGIDLVNQQNSDVIFFTGDLVNNKTAEVLPWMEHFSKLSAPYGVYSVLGNHDYGDYTQWNTNDEKSNNFRTLCDVQKEMGWDLLLNESRFIEKSGERIALVGVENWGMGGFKRAGDLNKSLAQVSDSDFKILLSHDPSHWEAEVLPHPYKIHLTLSGHTHGMQFGIDIPGWFKWSPVQWRYKQWAGLYEQNQQHINVNRGFGFLAYPGRVGMWPEISVITLKRAKPTV
ncbi:MAG: metallophosphoesterase [Bacteroidetes bacterium]|jgi:predicted MPP superfamily phosphohydrolase|nr:metallophosphoesterase [Bacteroidota bacterium]MDA0922710.1 metallophosphoesterase [Bacteroidota bacterium]MDA1288947.1 metallophosphoesterase [Bacteroidota bacterium]